MYYNLTGTTKADFYINGPQGSAIRVGTGVPSNGVGSDGDLFLSKDNNELYIKRSGVWFNITDTDLITIAGLTHTNGNVIRSNGTVWQSTTLSLNDLGDVAITGVASGNILYYNGINFINAAPGVTSGVQPYDADLTTIAGFSPADGNFIVGDGTAWVVESGNTARTSLGLGTGDSPTFVTVDATTSVVTPVINRGAAGDATLFTDAGANNITIGGSTSTVIVSGNLTINGVTTVVNSTNLDVTDKNITINKGGTTASATVSGINIEGDAATVVGYMRSASDNANLEFKAPTGSILTLDMNANNTIALGSPTAQDVIKYNGTSFVNAQMSLDNLSDVVVSSPANGQIIKYNGTNFVNTNASTPLIYNSGGLVNTPKLWVGSATANSSGIWSVDISSASFSTITSVCATASENTSNVSEVPLASITSVSTSTITGRTVESKNTGVLLGGNIEGLEFGDTENTVYVQVWGI